MTGRGVQISVRAEICLEISASPAPDIVNSVILSTLSTLAVLIDSVGGKIMQMARKKTGYIRTHKPRLGKYSR